MARYRERENQSGRISLEEQKVIAFREDEKYAIEWVINKCFERETPTATEIELIEDFYKIRSDYWKSGDVVEFDRKRKDFGEKYEECCVSDNLDAALRIISSNFAVRPGRER